MLIDKFKMFSGIAVVPVANSRSHSDIHYLWKLRKALDVLLSEESMVVTDQEIIDLHTSIVRGMLAVSKTHWYDDWDSTLDDNLPEDLKLASEGYYKPEMGGILELTQYDVEERQLYLDNNAVQCWAAPTKRKDVPKSHFFDPKNKKYPYKNPDGTINCGGVKAAKQAAGGARSGKKASAALRTKINRVWKNNCVKKK